MPAPRVALLLSLALPVVALARDPTCEVNVNVTLTEAGKKVPPPSREHPAYYFPLVAGWREEGAIVAGEKPPPRLGVAKQLAKTLAAEGYLVVGEKTPPPSVLFVFHWGYMNPQKEDFGSNDPMQQVFFNQKEMLALVGGSTLRNLDLSFERDAVFQDAQDNRYFVIVMAYDFADAVQKKKKTLLWCARMSTPSNGITMSEVVAPLITSGGPFFGRETTRPERITKPIVREGRVDIGTPVVVPDAPAGKTQAPDAKRK